MLKTDRTPSSKTKAHSTIRSHTNRSDVPRGKGTEGSPSSQNVLKSARKINRAHPQFIVGIGASAGGLEALRTLFGALKKPNDMAFVVVQHLAPTYRSRLTELIAHTTSLPVKEVEESQKLESGVIFITPPNKDVFIKNKKLHLTEPGQQVGPKPSIDRFLHSLAQDYEDCAIGIILSGTGTDGSRGIQSIKARGGSTFIQKIDSAKYDGMPKAAKMTGAIDAELTPEEIALALEKFKQEYSKNKEKQPGKLRSTRMVSREDTYFEILNLVERETGTPFGDYKPATIKRRIERRMAVTHSASPQKYLDYLKENLSEVEMLHQDVLISVTQFFRDSALFRILEGRLTQRIRSKSHDGNFRTWVVGCATGEEAYTVGIILCEICERLDLHLNIQIFATDIDDEALGIARKGTYSATALVEFSTKLREKYFTVTEDRYVVKQNIRDLVIFARHNVILDPPFLNLDLVTCRNVLIYFNSKLQEKVFASVHYALGKKGILFLGKSETVPASLNIFDVVDKHAKIYTRTEKKGELPRPLTRQEYSREAQLISKEKANSQSEDYFMALIASFAPDSVLIDSENKIKHIYGDAGQYLNLAAGEASYSITKLLPSLVGNDLTVLLHRAQKTKKMVRGRTHHPIGNKKVVLRLQVAPLGFGLRPNYLINFESMPNETKASAKKASESKVPAQIRLRKTEEELKGLREHLQTIVQEQEASNEELQSLNEELQSANEELQSSNEELETANEELQSTNEELTTVNQELNVRSSELQALNQTLQAVQNAMIHPLLIVDPALRLISLNPAARFLFRISDSDIGSNLKTIPFQSEMGQVLRRLEEALKKGSEISFQFQTKERFFEVQVQLFRDHRNSVAGAVVTFVDNTELTRAFDEMRLTKTRLADILDNTPAIVTMKDTTGVITFANRKFCQLLGVPEDSVVGQTDEELFGQAMGEQIRERDFEVIKRRKPIQFEEKIVLKDRVHWWASSRFPLTDDKKRVQAVCTISLDVSDRIMYRRQLEIFRQAISSVMTGIVIFEESKHGIRSTFVTEEIHKTLGLEPGGIRGLGLSQALERFFPHKKPEQIRELADQIHSHSNWSAVVDLPRHASSFQEEKWMELRSSHLDFPDSQNRQIILTIFDATQRVMDQRVITQQQDELTRFSRFSALGEISAGIAHEINTPLNVITTKTDLLRKLAQLNRLESASVSRLAGDIDQTAKNISSIVMGLKSLAAPDSTKSEAVDLVKLIRDTLKICEFRLHRIGVDLRLRLPTHEVRVECFPVQVSQILINLVNNSLDAIASRPERWIEIELREKEKSVSVIVTDCGDGIEPNLAEKIMTPFFTTKKDKKGTGIGLSLSRTIARNHGGELSLDRDSANTSFLLELPKNRLGVEIEKGETT